MTEYIQKEGMYFVELKAFNQYCLKSRILCSIIYQFKRKLCSSQRSKRIFWLKRQLLRRGRIQTLGKPIATIIVGLVRWITRNIKNVPGAWLAFITYDAIAFIFRPHLTFYWLVISPDYAASILVTLYVHLFTLLHVSALLYLFVFKLLNTISGLCCCSLAAGTLKDTGVLEIPVRDS